jgi:glutamate synthase domain-containing protein 3
MNISACDYRYNVLNSIVKDCAEDVTISDCFGERFIAAGLGGKSVTINGTPGNALGCYLDGATVVVNGNAQDAVGDTMNDGRIIIHGSAGDALGYAMRGGIIYVKGNAGYRTGIHMKEYQDKKPVIVIGGSTGSFLGEYQAGGLLIVLGLGVGDRLPVGGFTGTGMHGGSIFIRSSQKPEDLPDQVMVDLATAAQLPVIEPYLKEFSALFGADLKELKSGTYYVLSPNAKNPYKRLYTNN